MGASTKLREEANFTQELRWVLEAMKQVAASELKRLERQPTTHEALVIELRGCFRLLASARVPSVLVAPTSPTTAAICFTSDAGFIGDLNVRVVREGAAAAGPGPLFVIGEQGRRVLMEQRKSATPYPRVTNLQAIEELRPLWESLAPRYLEGAIGRVRLVYPKYLSRARQEVVVEPLLPYEGPVTDMVSRSPLRKFLLETPLAATERALAGWWIRAALARAAWHARLSELAARTNHLEGAVDELARQSQVLTLQYFHVFHEEMDKAIREVYASQQQVGGAG